MLDQKTRGWTPGPLSGAFFVFSGDLAISGGLEMAPALPPSADTPMADIARRDSR